MQFLSDVTCAARTATASRFRGECWSSNWRAGIADVLELTISEAVEFFAEHPGAAAPQCRWPTSAWTTCASASRCRRSPAARPQRLWLASHRLPAQVAGSNGENHWTPRLG